MSRLVPALLVLSALLALAPRAAAQLELPSRGSSAKEDDKPKRREQRGDVAPHIDCTICGERNYTVAIDSSAENGHQRAHCVVCQKQTLHKVPRRGGKSSGGGLELPSGVRVRTAPESDAAALAESESTPEPTAGGDAESTPRAAQLVLAEVRRVKSPNDPVVSAAAGHLVQMGEGGLIASRQALLDEDPRVVVAGGRALLIAALESDRERVIRRLRGRVPTKAAAPLLAALVELDPVAATPALLAEFLAHSLSPMRVAAERHLRVILTVEGLPALRVALESSRSDARGRAVDLLSRFKDEPVAVDLLMERLADPRAKVALRVVEALARSRDERVERALLVMAFDSEWLLRPEAYALLTLIEREDKDLEPLLDARHVEALLRGLDSSEPFVGGTCAAALAGIGFRSTQPDRTMWLDTEVPQALVAVVSGQHYFDDFSALQPTALRRLGMISGLSRGMRGPEWASWWLESRGDFLASRAAIRVEERDERQLRLTLRVGGAAPLFFELVGPDAEERPNQSEVFWLSEVQALDLVGILQQEGVLGIERMPGIRGGQLERGRTLTVEIANQAKSFSFGPGVEEVWFDRLCGTVRAFREKNLWQRLLDPRKHSGRRGLWESEHVWWDEDHTEFERVTRLKTLALEHAHSLTYQDRELVLALFEDIYREPKSRSLSDFNSFLGLLGDEPLFTLRANRWAYLATAALGLDGDASVADESSVQASLAEDLLDLLITRFGADAAPSIGGVLAVLGPDRARQAAVDQRPLMRALAAELLASRAAGEDGSEDAELLLALLDDPVLSVEVEAVAAAGRYAVTAVRTEVLRRARSSSQHEVRAAALRAIGRIGGRDAREALLVAVPESDPMLQVAAVEGLVSLNDPRTSSLLVTLLRPGRSREVVDAARRALDGIGDEAHPVLFDAMRNGEPSVVREASLLLSRDLQPEAASVLMSLLTDDPADRLVMNELAILTCVDLREEPDPAASWWEWWDRVRHDDSSSWFRAALEQHSMPAPSAEAFEGEGTLEGVGYLLAAIGLPESHLAERGRRELERLTGRDLGPLPPSGSERDLWRETLYDMLSEQRR